MSNKDKTQQWESVLHSLLSNGVFFTAAGGTQDLRDGSTSQTETTTALTMLTDNNILMTY